MDVGRFCDVLAADGHATHQRVSTYVRARVARYRGMGFTAREEWVAEQTVDALRTLLGDVVCTDEERRAVTEFLDLAAQEVTGRP